MLHRGFDSPKIDTIAVLRATESAALYLQIIGRGLRLHETKTECLILDYAENLERHAPDGDIFEPEIRSYRSNGSSGELKVTCPVCHGVNYFSARKNEEGYNLTPDGYFADLAGNLIKNLDGVPIPSHYGRRCTVEHLTKGKHVQCDYRWSHKKCPECGAENDIAAKYCSECKAELVSPEEKLVIEAGRLASDPYRVRFEPVESMNIRRWPSSSPDKPDTVRVDYHIAQPPHAVTEWLSPESGSSWMVNRWIAFAKEAWPGQDVRTIDDALMLKADVLMPKLVAFRKKQGSRFYEIQGKQW
jgi:DNA repair protein RadD